MNDPDPGVRIRLLDSPVYRAERRGYYSEPRNKLSQDKDSNVRKALAKAIGYLYTQEDYELAIQPEEKKVLEKLANDEAKEVRDEAEKSKKKITMFGMKKIFGL